MLIQYAAITHPGRVRRNNEDAYLVSGIEGEEPLVNALRNPHRLCPAGLLAAVADGMGGAAAGEVASREGLMSLDVNLFARWGRFPASRHHERALWQALKASAEAASLSVLDYSDHERHARGMGATLTAVLVWNGHAYLAQVGDSRAYLYRGERLAQLTTDQTVVNEMIASGLLTAEQARTHPQRSMITQALGAPQPLRVVLSKVSLRRGDRVLICSDGLHGEASVEVMAAAFAARYSPARTLEVMLQAALEAGGRDNITGVLLSLDDPSLPLPGASESLDIVQPTPKDLAPAAGGFFSRLGRRLAGNPS